MGVPSRQVVRGAHRVGAAFSRAALWLRPSATERPPWERSVLDDIAARRPWNLAVKTLRLRARMRLSSLEDGVTVVIVNWNTRDVVADVVRAVHHYSLPEVRLLVVDNGSTDGSAAMLANMPDVRALRLPTNVGHGLALDLAVCSTRTQIAVLLDSDAIPLTSQWLMPTVNAVRNGAVLAGLHASRGFVHPAYAAVDVEAFVRRKLSFQVHRPPGNDTRWGENAWDTGELLTPRLRASEVHLVERTDNPVDGLPGMTIGGVVYHHGGVTRSADGGTAGQTFAEWRAACTKLGLHFLTQEGPP